MIRLIRNHKFNGEKTWLPYVNVSVQTDTFITVDAACNIDFSISGSVNQLVYLLTPGWFVYAVF